MFKKIIKGLKDVWCGTLEFDTEPKKDSFNPVTSGGVYEAINGAVGAKEIVYFDVDPSDPPSGLYNDIGTALSNDKEPVIKIDGDVYFYTSTGTDKYIFVGGYDTEIVNYTTVTVSDDDSVVKETVDTIEGMVFPLYYHSKGEAFTVADKTGHALTKTEIADAYRAGQIFMFSSYPASNTQAHWGYCCDINIESDNTGYADFFILSAFGGDSYEWQKYSIRLFSGTEFVTLWGPNTSYSRGYSGSYADGSTTVSVSTTQNFNSTQKAKGRDNIGAASASDVTALQSQVSSLSNVSAYTVKGEATVAQLNAGPSGIQAGWAYQLTDSGTLTDGTLAVVAGDTVAWDGTKWFPLVRSDYYATKTYAHNVAHSIAPEFDPTRDENYKYLAGDSVTYTDGKVYVFEVDHYGPWDANDVRLSSVTEIVENSIMESKTDTFSYTSRGIGQEWASYEFNYSGKAGKQYRFTVSSNDDTASTNVNGMYLRLKDTSNVEHDIIPMSATEWVFDGSVEYDFVAVVVKFKKILSSYTYSIECVEKSLEEAIEDLAEKVDDNYETLDDKIDGVAEDVSDLQADVSDLQADVTNIYDEIPRTFTETGKNNTYIHHDITDLVIPGKKYKFKLPQTAWELATNTEDYSVNGFVISYNTGGSETYVEQAMIGSGKDYFSKDLKSEYTINVPSNLVSLSFGLRAKSGVNVKFKLELDESDEYDILHMYPRERMLPRVGVMKRKTPYGYSANNTPKALLWVSDIHGMAANVERIEKFRKEYSSFIDDVLNTGDCVGDNLGDYSQYETMLEKGADKWLVAVGNHDVTHQGSSYKGWGAEDTIASIYEKYVGQMNVTGVQGATNKNYYYKDYTGGNGSCKAVRLIVLDSCINPSSVTASHSGVSGAETEAYYGDQLTWFQGVLADAVTNSLAVVVATHYVNATVELLSSTGFTSMSGVGNTVACTMSGDYLDAVDTFIGNGGEFVTWLAGHAHQDHIGVLDGHPNQLIIHINRGSARNDGNAESVGLYRPSGEITEATDAFNCISFDTYYKRIRMVRVGCNLDNFGRPMDMICIDYGNKRIIDPVMSGIDNADKMRVISEALVNLDARLKAAEESISNVNIGSRIADEFDTQSLKVGGEDINTVIQNAIGG